MRQLVLLTVTIFVVSISGSCSLKSAPDRATTQPIAVKDLDGDWARMAPIVPRSYLCLHASSPVTIDGVANELAWANAAWTDDFVDIEASRRPTPRFRTRAKMVWDDKNLYVHAELDEPHVWGTITKKNTVMFHDNDFEIFIDPDGDHHQYYEFEMNALNSIWELTLTNRIAMAGRRSTRRIWKD